jgi:murein DD-endopeptidase MepM/ murein hydrolase activator NlpD
LFLKDVHQKFNTAPLKPADASSNASARLLLECPPTQDFLSRSYAIGRNYSIATVSIALSFGATGFLLSEPQAVQATEATISSNTQTQHSFPQGETFMIPAPVTLATAPEAQPVIESSQLVAAVTPSSVGRVEPELPSIKHVVAGNETFWSIAQRYGVSVEAIAKLNGFSTNQALTLGQAIKIPAYLNQPTAAIPQQFTPPSATAEVASIQPNKQVLSEPESSLKAQEDEALSTLRAKQQDLAESIDQLRSQKTEVIFDASETPEIQPKTLISSAAVTPVAEPTRGNVNSVVIDVPSPQEAVNPVATKENFVADENKLVANRAIASSQRLPQPPNLNVPTSEWVTPKEDSTDSIALTTETVIQPNAIVAEKVESRSETVATEIETESSTLFARVPSQTHTVRPGETLYAIARRYGISGNDLITANGLDNPNVIAVNQTLQIPFQQKAQQPQQEQSNFVALLPQTEATQGVNRGSQTLASAPNLNNQSDKLAVSFDVSAESAVNKLKADIARMRQDYQQQRSTLFPKTSAAATPVVEFTVNRNTAVNPEWQGKQTTSESVAEVRTVTVPEATQEVAAASSNDIANYNSLLRLSVGEVVTPNLPPLAAPGEYLPGAEVFNGYIWPAKGVLTSGYGRRWGRMHKGIDIAAPVGTPIFAAAGGEVISAGWNSGGFGNLVKIKHDDDSITLYAHNSRILVRNGQQVKQGQQISAMGSTGFSTGPHLHFEIHKSGQGASNPVAFLPKK